MGVNTFGKISGFLITLILARIFTPDVIGMLGFANAIAGIVFLTLKFGLENYILREIPQNPDSASLLFRQTITLNIFSILVSSILFIIISLLLIGSSLELKILIVIFISTILGVISELSIAYYKALFQIIYEVYLRLSHRLSLLLIILPLIYFSKDLNIYLVSILFLAFLISLISVLILRFKFNFRFVFTDLKNALSIIKHTYKFALLSVAAFVLVQLDIIFVKTILGNEDAGYYKIASIFYFSFTIIPGSMMGVILPILSKYKNSPANFESVQNNVYRFLAILSVIIVYTVSSFAKPLLELLFSGKYNPSIPVLMVLVWTIVPYYLEYISGYSLIALGHEKELLNVNFYAIMVGLICNVLFIHWYGIMGAAFATVIAITVKWLLELTRLKHYKKLFKKNLRIYLFLLFSLINFVAYRQVDMNIIVRYSLVMLTMLFIVKITGLLEKNDIYQLKKLFMKE